MAEKAKGRKSFAAVLVDQGDSRFYMISMPSKELSESCYVNRRQENGIEGFQRKLDPRRAQAIADYIDENKGAIPTAIIVSAQDSTEFSYNSKNKTASFVPNSEAFMILDGQHRVFGYALARTEIRVPVIIFSGLTLRQEVNLFIDINTKQKPVPPELLLDIQNLANTEDEAQQKSREVFDLFSDRADSILVGLMSKSEKSKVKISRKTFNMAMRKIYDVLYNYDSEETFHIINNYLASIKTVFIDNNRDFNKIIVQPTIFRGIIDTLPDFAEMVALKYDLKYTVNNFFNFTQAPFSAVAKSRIGEQSMNQSEVANLISTSIRKNRRL